MRVYVRMQSIAELERHFVQLDADLVNTTREAERDMYDQRNQQLQTLILSCTVMFAALSTIIVQGYLPQGTDNTLTVAFAITNGISFAFLLVCLVICIEVQRLASRFMGNSISL